MAIELLGTLRHRCLQCGGICHSAVPLRTDEVKGIEKSARKLGISKPIDGDHLRRIGGKCVFLAKDRRCKLHSRFGAEAKPVICQQFPVVSIRTEDSVRVGVDPGCLMTSQSWRDGPELVPDQLLASKVSLPQSAHAAEQEILDATSVNGQTLGGLLAILTGEPSMGGPPAGFAARLAQRVRGSNLSARIRHPDTVLPLRDVLSGVADRIDSLTGPPDWALGSDEDAFAIEAIRRMVFLRIVHFFPLPLGTSLVVASGAVLCAWAHPEPEQFGPAMSAWCRIVRTPEVVAELVPDPSALQWLAHGS